MKLFLLAIFLGLGTLSYGAQDSFGMVSQTEVNVTGSSTKMLSYNSHRVYLLVQNQGTNTIIVKIGSVQSGTEGVEIPAGGNWEPSRAPIDSIYAESVSGTQPTLFLEGD